MKLESLAIPHVEQRYDTAGDYWWESTDPAALGVDTLQIRISQLPDPRMEHAVLIHELVEALICKWCGIEEEEISAFDEAYESTRSEGNVEEPGDSPNSPYHLAHGFATAAERIYCAAVGLNWKIYTDAVNALVWSPEEG